jgi:hypothetical protein
MPYSAIFAGNVGIGTTNPQNGIHIESSSSEADRSIRLAYDGTYYNEIKQAGSAGLRFDTSASAKAYDFRQDGISKMYIDYTGNVGIGTTNPYGKFTVSGVDGITRSIALDSREIKFRGDGVAHFSIFGPDTGQPYLTIQNTSSNYPTGITGSDLFTVRSTGNVGIGTTSPVAKLDVAGNIKVGSFGGDGDAVPKSYIDSAISGSTYWAANGDDIYNSNNGNVGIGIGTTAPGSLLTIANDNWVTALNSDGTGYVNMFKVNSNNQLELGTAINAGTFEFAPDSGFNTFVNMAVTSAPTVGTVEGYSMKIDGNNILSLYSEANGSGGIQNASVGIGTSMPVSELEVIGTVTATGFSGPLTGTISAGNVSSGAFASNTGGGHFSFPANVGIGTTNSEAKLDIIGGSFPLQLTTSDYVSGSTGSRIRFQFGSATGNTYTKIQTTDSGGVSASNLVLQTDSGNVGIGTSNPTEKLHVAGNVRVTGTLSTQTGSDFAEEFVVSDYIEPASVVVMGDLGYKSVKESSEAFDSSVVGVVSDNPSIVAGKVDSDNKAIVAMVGVVSVKVVDDGGEISKGDLLTSSSVSGYAMKADKYVGGTIIGKALEDFTGEKGVVKVLVNLQ